MTCGFIGDAPGVENFEYDTDLSFFADWASGSPVQASVLDWLETRQIVEGQLDQSRLEAAISLLPDHSDAWELGVGLRQTDLNANRLVADSLWLEGRQLPATADEAEVDRTLLNRWSYVRLNWQPGAFIGGWEARALHVDESDEWLLCRGRDWVGSTADFAGPWLGGCLHKRRSTSSCSHRAPKLQMHRRGRMPMSRLSTSGTAGESEEQFSADAVGTESPGPWTM